MRSFGKPSRGLVVASVFLTLLTWRVAAVAGQLNLSWVDGATDELGFSIERSTGTTGTYAEIATTGAGVTVYADPAVTDGTTYCYRVRAFDAVAYSDYSNTACGATAQVYGLSVVRMGAGSGTVVSTPSGIICGTTCSGSYASGTAVTLTATAAAGSTFTGWTGGGCSGTGSCTVILTGTVAITASFDPQPISLGVSVTGTGTGTVTSTPTGISCGTTCSASFPYGTAVTLTAAPAAGSMFAGWSGACAGTGPCTVSLTSATAVTAAFAPSPPPSAMLTVSVSGKGTVTSAPAGINCGVTCSASFPGGTTVVLTARAGSNFVFKGWSGACSGTGNCTVTMTTATTVVAMFGNLNKK